MRDSLLSRNFSQSILAAQYSAELMASLSRLRE
jgi:hypothetical protein